VTSPANRLLTFGGTTLGVDYSGDRPAAIVEFLFNRIPSPAAGTMPATLLRLTDDAEGVMTLASGDETLCADRLDGPIASWLLHAACTSLATSQVDGLMLHAAAVGWEGRGIVLPGVTGSGKSMLAALLTDRGFAYLSDELAHVPASTTAVTGFCTPLKIKRAGLEALRRNIPLDSGRYRTWTGNSEVLLDPRAEQCASGPLPLSAIVFPRHRLNARFALTPLSTATAGLRLMRVLVNSGWLPDHGFREAARLAGSAACYELEYASLDEIDQHLGLLQQLSIETTIGAGAQGRARTGTP
jgi:hypothetical protein